MTADPTIVARGIESSDAYDEQFHALVTAGWAVEKSYWQLVITDVIEALQAFRPTFDTADDGDGFVSVEVSPECAHDTGATVATARNLHDRIREPNQMVKILGTAEGVDAIEVVIGEGRSINVTLLFSLGRYTEVLEAYLAGLQAFARRGGDLSTVHSVASFFVRRIDTEVDRRLDALDTPGSSAQPLSLRGQAGVAQAKLAYRLSREAHAGQRWNRLAQRGARVQRPLWASTSTKNPRYADKLYADNLVGPKSINTVPEHEAAFEDHGTLAHTVDADMVHAEEIMDALAAAGVDMDDVGRTLEVGRIDAFVTPTDTCRVRFERRRRGSPAAERTERTGGLEVARDHWADGAAIVGDGQGWSFKWAGRDVGPQIRPHRHGRTRWRSVRPGRRGDTYVHEWIHEPAGHPAHADTAGPMPGAPLAASAAYRRGIRRIHRSSPRAVRRHRRPRPAGPPGDLRRYGGVRRGAQAPPRLKRSQGCWSRRTMQGSRPGRDLGHHPEPRAGCAEPVLPTPPAETEPIRGSTMVKFCSLPRLSAELLESARASGSGRATHMFHVGHDHALRETVVALADGSGLGERTSPGEATLQVHSGRVELSAGDEVCVESPDDRLGIPPLRHELAALADSAVLRTVSTALAQGAGAGPHHRSGW